MVHACEHGCALPFSQQCVGPRGNRLAAANCTAFEDQRGRCCGSSGRRSVAGSVFLIAAWLAAQSAPAASATATAETPPSNMTFVARDDTLRGAGAGGMVYVYATDDAAAGTGGARLTRRSSVAAAAAGGGLGAALPSLLLVSPGMAMPTSEVDGAGSSGLLVGKLSG